MKKKLVVLLSVLLVTTNCMYVSAAPLSVLGNSNTLVVEDETSEDLSEEEVSEEVASEEEGSDSEQEDTVAPDETNEQDETDELDETGVPDGEEILEKAVKVEINSENFPDNNFRSFVKANYDGNTDGFLSSPEIEDATEMIILGESVQSMQGIEYLTSLKILRSSYNPVVSLDLSKNTALEELMCENGALRSLDVSGCASLKSINVAHNQLTSLDVSSLTELEGLSCNFNQLTSLDASKNTKLTSLGCGSNAIETLDLSNNTELTYLQCNSNQLSELDLSKNTKLQTLICGSNKLTKMDLSNNTNLENLDCGSNSLGTLDVGKLTLLKSLRCQSSKLTVLDVSRNTNLESLICEYNQLSFLDLSNCPILLTIMKEYNKTIRNGHVYYEKNFQVPLSWDETVEVKTENLEINETNFPDENFRSFIKENYDENKDGFLSSPEIENATEMAIFSQNIGNLQGIEYFTSLKVFRAYYNSMDSLDLSKNTTLEELTFEWGNLGSLNISGCTSLKSINVVHNQLKELDVSDFTNLEILSCGQNQITSLDVSNNTNLQSLNCGGNQISELDLSSNTNLTSLGCTSNKLTVLDIGNSKDLKELYCDANLLENLDISQNTKLEHLSCGNNKLTDLDVSKQTEITWLDFSSNQLTNLDISNNTKLERLFCHRNKLSTLDISNCPTLIKYVKEYDQEEAFGYIIYIKNNEFFLSHDTGVEVITEKKVTDIFDDVKEGAWYVPAVQYVYNNNLMAGTNGGKSFSPNSNITRGMIATVLYSNEGKPATSIANPFSDVKDGAWYYNAVLWAKEKGVADGKSDGTFGPNNNITRQDLAMMLYAYAQYKNYNLDKNADALKGFSDAGKVSGYAKNAMTWAVTQGILSGKGGRLDPAGKATRAEFAQMIMKLLQANQ